MAIKLPLSASSSSSLAARYIAPLPRRSILQVSGPDAQRFLKGLTCKDVEATKGGYSGFLNASGRVLHAVFIFPLSPTDYLISHNSPPTHPSPLPTLLPPFRLRAKVRIKDVTSQWSAWAAWGDPWTARRSWKFGSGGAAEANWDDLPPLQLGQDEVGCWDLRAGPGERGMGRQILVPGDQRPSLFDSHARASTSEYDLRRMLLGVPEGSREIPAGAALPLESCMDIQGGVDFRKGCYVGQELTVRTYHTGATRKRIMPIRLVPLSATHRLLSEIIETPSEASPSLPIEGSDITYHPPHSSRTQKARSAGRMLSLHETSSVGLGLVRLEMAERSWWSGNIMGSTVGAWVDSGLARLSTRIDGNEWGVYVGKGEAYRAALEADMNT